MEISRLTSKYQATVPALVRKALELRAGDAVAWSVAADGAVRIRKAEPVDAAFAGSVSSTLTEWGSRADEAAWRDL